MTNPGELSELTRGNECRVRRANWRGGRNKMDNMQHYVIEFNQVVDDDVLQFFFTRLHNKFYDEIKDNYE